MKQTVLKDSAEILHKIETITSNRSKLFGKSGYSGIPKACRILLRRKGKAMNTFSSLLTRFKPSGLS